MAKNESTEGREKSKGRGKIPCRIKKVELDEYQWHLVYFCLEKVRKKARELVENEKATAEDREVSTEIAEDITLTQILIAIQAGLKH